MTKTDSMKTQTQTRRILVGLFLSLSVAGFSGFATSAYADVADVAEGNPGAQGRGGDSGRGHHGPKDPSRLIKHFDKNKDGQLAVAELPERLREHLGTADTNKDGILSVAELQARGALRAKARFARMDKDANGVLTPSELGEKRWAHLKVADANGDNKLTADELRAARASGKLKGGHKQHEPRGERGKANNTEV